MGRAQLQDFFQTAPGLLLHRWEASLMDAVMPQLTGETALQVGAPYAKALRSANHAVRVAASADAAELAVSRYADNVVAIPEALPFEAEAFDLVVLLHCLEFSEHKDKVLEEALRVLKPEGRLLVTSINPWGPWMLARKDFAGCDCKPLAAVELRQKLKDLVAFDKGAFGVYCPSVKDDPAALMHWKWTEKAGERWWPQLANAYVVSGTKKVVALTPVGRADKVLKVAGACA